MAVSQGHHHLTLRELLGDMSLLCVVFCIVFLHKVFLRFHSFFFIVLEMSLSMLLVWYYLRPETDFVMGAEQPSSYGALKPKYSPSSSYHRTPRLPSFGVTIIWGDSDWVVTAVIGRLFRIMAPDEGATSTLCALGSVRNTQLTLRTT